MMGQHAPESTVFINAEYISMPKVQYEILVELLAPFLLITISFHQSA